MYGLKQCDTSVVLSIERDVTTIGRDPCNNIVINEMPVSRNHSCIVKINKRYFIKDKNTVNGTFIEEQRIFPNRETLIKVGDFVGIGTKAMENIKCTFQVVFIQIDNINEISLRTDVVDSSFDCRLNSAQNNLGGSHKISLGVSEQLTNYLMEGTSDINTDTSTKRGRIIILPENNDQKSENTNDLYRPTSSSGVLSSENAVFENKVELIATVATMAELSGEGVTEAVHSKNFLHVEDQIMSNDSVSCNAECSPDDVMFIDLCSDDDEELTAVKEDKTDDVNMKPALFTSEGKYLILDKITILDDDDHDDIDFPPCQLNNNHTDNLPDFSTSFGCIYHENEDDDSNPSSLHYMVDPWLTRKELIADKRHAFESDNNCQRPERSFSKDDLDTPSKPTKRKDPSKIQESVFTAKTIHDPVPNNYQPLVLLKDYHGNEKPLSKLPMKRKPIEIVDNERISIRVKYQEKKKRTKPGPQSKTRRCYPTGSEQNGHKEHVKEGHAEISPVESDKKLLKKRRKEKLREITVQEESLSTNFRPESLNRSVVKCIKKHHADEVYKDDTTNTSIMHIKLEVAEEKRKESHVMGECDSQVPDHSIEFVPRGGVQASLKEEKKTMKNLIILESSANEENMLSVKINREHNEQNHHIPLNTTETILDRKIIAYQNNSGEKQRKSLLKLGSHVIDTTEQKNAQKKVHFYNGDPDYQLLSIDSGEHCLDVYASSFKSENLIKKRQSEFELAIALVCRWKVDWLKERNISRPIIYLKTSISSESSDQKLLEYKENLKEVMFYHLWDAVLQSHNKPTQDLICSTQCLNDGKKGIYTLWIVSVNTSKRPPYFRTITANRDVDENTVPDELTDGQMVMLHLHVKQAKEISKFSKANIFAYVASVHQIQDEDLRGVKRQRVIFKILQSNFEIMIGVIKVKVLTYTKFLLKRFKPLAMVNESPLIDLLVSQRSEPLLVVPVLHDDQNFVNGFLDPSQKSAIVKCLNSISLAEPSICLVDGPPGAGKSVMIASLMHEIFSKARRQRFPSDLKVLIVTKNSNIADDLVYRLEKRDNSLLSMNVLRYGRSRASHKFKCGTFGDQIRKLIEKCGHSLVDLEEEKQFILAKKNSLKLILENENLTEDERVNAEWELVVLENEYADLLNHSSKTKDQLLAKAARSKTFENADIIVTSIDECWPSPYSHFENDFVLTEHNRGDILSFTVCIFDDADFIDESHMLIPIMLMVPKLVLVGDSRNEFYLKQGDQSPFRRLLRDFKRGGSNAFAQLNHQHRMQRSIFRWFGNCFKLSCQHKHLKTSRRLPPLFVVHLQIENCIDLDYDGKWRKQADFCYRLALKMNEIESELPIVIIVVSNKEKKILRGMMRSYAGGEHPKINVCTWYDTIGREYEAVIACLPTKPYPSDKWLYIASSRARSHLFVCGYFDDDSKTNQYFQWLRADAESKKISKTWNVDNKDFPGGFPV